MNEIVKRATFLPLLAVMAAGLAWAQTDPFDQPPPPEIEEAPAVSNSPSSTTCSRKASFEKQSSLSRRTLEKATTWREKVVFMALASRKSTSALT